MLGALAQVIQVDALVVLPTVQACGSMMVYDDFHRPWGDPLKGQFLVGSNQDYR
jgi:hypothetical protein